MIEVKEILNDFEEIDVKSLATEYGITDERASIAVSLYNKALNKMHIGSYDSARIDLRKSVNMYPSFVESRILLGICVFALGDRTDAVAIFNTIRGENRERALDYLDKLHELSTRPESASFRSSSRQSRVPDAVFSSENKLDEIMNASDNNEKVENKSDGFDDGFDDDEDVEIAVNGEIHSSEESSIVDSQDKADSDDDSQDTDAADARTETEKPVTRRVVNDTVAPYDGMRRASADRRTPNNNGRTPAKSYYEKDTKAESPKKKTSQNESLDRANRKIANLTIQKARMTILAMAIGLCCVILLIVVISLSISNSELEDEIKALKNNKVSSQKADTENNKTENQDKNPENPGGNTENSGVNVSKAKAAYDNAKTLFGSEKYVEAADLLAETDLTYLDASTKAEAEKLYKDSVNKFSGNYFNAMYSNVGPENWSEVIEYGLPVYHHNIERSNPDFAYSGSAVCFNLGKAYEMTGNAAKAKEFYNATINNYPTSSDAGYASYRLSQLA